MSYSENHKEKNIKLEILITAERKRLDLGEQITKKMTMILCRYS